jgi:hypothetical protein
VKITENCRVEKRQIEKARDQEWKRRREVKRIGNRCGKEKKRFCFVCEYAD